MSNPSTTARPSGVIVTVDTRDREIRRLGARVAEPFLVTLRGFGVTEEQLFPTQAIISVSVPMKYNTN